VDLIGVFSLVGLTTVAKHERAYSENQHMFIPFAFDTFDFLTLEAVDVGVSQVSKCFI
jgi:hypothetical protein